LRSPSYDAIPGYRNVTKEEAEKILQYKDLITENQCMWNVKAKAMPVVTGATGTMSISLRQYMSKKYRKSTKLKYCKEKSHIGHCAYTS